MFLNQQQLYLALAVFGGVALAFLYVYHFGSKNQYPCLCEKCQYEEQVPVTEESVETQQQVFGTERVGAEYGNVVAQVYGIVTLAIVSTILYAIYQTPAAQKVAMYGQQFGKQVGL